MSSVVGSNLGLRDSSGVTLAVTSRHLVASGRLGCRPSGVRASPRTHARPAARTTIVGPARTAPAARRPSSRARVTARSPYRRRSRSAASIALRRRGSSAANSASCSRSPRFDAVTPSSRIRRPRTSGRARSSAARKIGSVRSVGSGSVRWRVIVRNDESRILTVTVAARTPDCPKPPGDAVGHGQQRPLDHLAVGRVDVERVLVPDRLRRVALADRVGVDPARAVDERRPVLAEAPLEQVRAAAPRGRRSCATPYSRSAAAVFSPTPHSRVDRRAAPGTPPPRPAARRPARRACARSDAILATSLVGATPTEIVRRDLVAHGVLDRARDRRRRRRTARASR